MTRLTAAQVAHALRAHPHGVTPSILSADLRATPSATRTHLTRKLSHLHLTADEVHGHLQVLAAAGHVTWTSDRGQPWQWYGVAQ